VATRKPKTAAAPRRRYTHVQRVEVQLWGQTIGAVAMDPHYGFYVFRYTPAFCATGIEPSPLHMRADPDRSYLFTDLPVETYKRLPAMLSDALPDDFGNALTNRWMADRGVTAAEVTSLDRLAYMGNRAMGALQFKPTKGPAAEKASVLEMSQLVAQARQAVKGTLEDDDQAQQPMRNIIEVGTSAGGARAKAVIAWNPATNQILSGQVDAPEGFTQWLLKFDGMGQDNELGTSQDYGRIEYAYSLMAKAAGIEMTECRLLEENSRAHFMTQRFDRGEVGVRHHMQTLCAMDHLDYKKRGANSYAQLFSVVSRLGLPYEQMEEAYRRMVFNVMARNCDDHAKNFSFRLRQGAAWELAPAYDVTFAHNPKGEWTAQHLMSVNGKFKGFVLDDLLLEAQGIALGTARRVIDRVRAAVSDWPKFAKEAGVANTQAKIIQEQHIDL